MKVLGCSMAALLMAASPMVASAQSTQTSTTTTTTTQTTQTTTLDPDDDTFFGTDSHWIGSAFVGGKISVGMSEQTSNILFAMLLLFVAFRMAWLVIATRRAMGRV